MLMAHASHTNLSKLEFQVAKLFWRGEEGIDSHSGLLWKTLQKGEKLDEEQPKKYTTSGDSFLHGTHSGLSRFKYLEQPFHLGGCSWCVCKSIESVPLGLFLSFLSYLSI